MGLPGENPDLDNAQLSGQLFPTNKPVAGYIPVANADGTFTWTAPGDVPTGGVVVSGTPSAGDVITADSPTTASWKTQAAGLTGVTHISGVTVSGTPSATEVLTATSGTAADWAAP
jgi:hypothetical protein